ncbi:MAG: imidazolonepropionase [Caulobacteraceae bacterium]
MRCDRLWRNASLATLRAGQPALGEIEFGCIASWDGRIAFVGREEEGPGFEAGETIDCEGRWITPGLIDCHTHLLYAGSRSAEFERRLAGESYEEIARSGGGILSTVAATRRASLEDLIAEALPRLDALVAEGITTVEIKSGYGLSLEAELRQLRAIADLAGRRVARVVPTLLAAHALPPEYAGERERYLDLVCDEIIPRAAKAHLATSVDAFCEGIGFSPDEVRRVFEAARTCGLHVKLHAEQLSNSRGAEMAANFGALSADHLEHLDESGARALARAGTIAVLLPGAFYFSGEAQRPPVALLRSLGVPMALATDCNPGTSPLTSPLLAMNMGAVLFGLTIEECLAGFTRNAAAALGLQSEVGTLEEGKSCDLAIWEIERPADLVYRLGFNPLWRRVWKGR